MPFPTADEEAETSIPVMVAYQEPAPVASDFIPGDTVELLRSVAGEPVETALGVVAEVGATALTLGTRVYDSADGWQFALVSRVVALPAALSEIDAVTVAGKTVRLIGRGDVWRDTSGTQMPVDNIRSWVSV